MSGLSAVVFALSWWSVVSCWRADPRKPVLVLAAPADQFRVVVGLDAVRVITGRRC
jgi:hypothetical protein